MDHNNISNNEELNQKEYKAGFENIKSDFVLKKIFVYIEKIKLLKIIESNKKMKTRLNINIDDYKEYSQLYSSIELELKPDENIKRGNFINIASEEMPYYHIYFDNSKEETKRNYLNENEKVEIIRIIINHQITSLAHLFYGCKINSITFKKFIRTNIIDMNCMFYGCELLKEINFSNFNTTNVKDMTYMFQGCKLLKKLDLSNFNTINVTKMCRMFQYCESLEELNVSSFNTNNVNTMSGMFCKCKSLKELDIYNFNTNKVKYMSYIFDGCESLIKLKYSENFTTKSDPYATYMFIDCPIDIHRNTKVKYEEPKKPKKRKDLKCIIY